jgi:hypothetical protein
MSTFTSNFQAPTEKDFQNLNIPSIRPDINSEALNINSEAMKQDALTLKYVLNATMASSVSNIIGTALGHPLDTIRVRMQLEGKHVTFS